LLCNLLASHDSDPRYQDPDVKARIASLYLPLINIVIDALPQLHDPNHETKTRGNQHLPNEDVHGIDQDIAMAISGSSVYSSFISSEASVVRTTEINCFLNQP